MGGGGDTRIREPESQLALAEQAAINLNRYREIFVPLEDQFMETTMATFDQPNYDNAMGRASTQISGIYEDALGQFQNQATQRGLDPSSGRYMGGSDAIRVAQMRGMGGGAASAGMSNTDMGLEAATSIIRAGQGLQNDAMQGQIAVARNDLDLARQEATDQFRSNQSLAGVFGTGAGIATGYAAPRLGMYG